MKMIIIGPIYPYRGGIAHYTEQLAEALKEAGIQQEVISFKRQYPLWLYPGSSDKEPNAAAETSAVLFMLDPMNPFTWWKTARYITSESPELVVIQWWTTFMGPAFAALGWLLF